MWNNIVPENRERSVKLSPAVLFEFESDVISALGKLRATNRCPICNGCSRLSLVASREGGLINIIL